jgi:hypothetical protein
MGTRKGTILYVRFIVAGAFKIGIVSLDVSGIRSTGNTHKIVKVIKLALND